MIELCYEWGLIELKSNCFSWLDSLHGFEWLIYSSNISTAHSALSLPKAK